MAFAFPVTGSLTPCEGKEKQQFSLLKRRLSLSLLLLLCQWVLKAQYQGGEAAAKLDNGEGRAEAGRGVLLVALRIGEHPQTYGPARNCIPTVKEPCTVFATRLLISLRVLKYRNYW